MSANLNTHVRKVADNVAVIDISGELNGYGEEALMEAYINGQQRPYASHHPQFHRSGIYEQFWYRLVGHHAHSRAAPEAAAPGLWT